MDYSFDETQVAVRDLAAQILTGRPRTTAGSGDLAWQYNDLAWQDLAGAGLLGLALPESMGGSGAGLAEFCVVVQESAKAGVDVFLIEPVLLGAHPVARLGSEEQRAELLPAFCRGELVLTSALSTSARGTSEITADHTEDQWVLTGTANHVPIADRAHLVLVLAHDVSGRPGLFLIDPSSDGSRIAAQSSVDRRTRWQVTLDGYRVPHRRVVRAPDDLSEIELRAPVDEAAAARCLAQLGSCEAALSMTADHVSQRHQFGRPIGSFQAVAQRIADAYIDTAAIRLTAWRAAWLLAHGEEATEALAIATWWATDAASRVVESAMQLHAGQGVDLDYPLHRHFLSVRQTELALDGPAQRVRDLGDLVAAVS